MSKKMGGGDKVKRKANDFPQPATGRSDLVPLLPEDENNNVWTLQGTFYLVPYLLSLSNTMTIYRDQATKELTIFNALRATPETERKILALGKIRNVVKLGQFHGAADAYYVLSPQFESPKLWVLPGGSVADGLVTDTMTIETMTSTALPVANSKLFTFDGHPFPEGFMTLPLSSTSDGKAENVLVGCDGLVHMTPADSTWSSRFLGWALGLEFTSPQVNVPKPAPLWCRKSVEALGPDIMNHWYSELGKMSWTHYIGGHGVAAKNCDHAAIMEMCRKEIAKTKTDTADAK